MGTKDFSFFLKRRDKYPPWSYDRKDDELDRILEDLKKNWDIWDKVATAKDPPKEVDKERGLKMFISQCFNRTTDYRKCEFCEFRYRCFTEVGKRVDKE